MSSTACSQYQALSTQTSLAAMPRLSHAPQRSQVSASQTAHSAVTSAAAIPLSIAQALLRAPAFPSNPPAQVTAQNRNVHW